MRKLLTILFFVVTISAKAQELRITADTLVSNYTISGGGSLPIVIFPDSIAGVPVTSYTLQKNYYNVLGDSAHGYPMGDTLLFPNGSNGDVIEVKFSNNFSGGSTQFIGIGCYANGTNNISGFGAYCKWTFYNGKWY